MVYDMVTSMTTLTLRSRLWTAPGASWTTACSGEARRRRGLSLILFSARHDCLLSSQADKSKVGALRGGARAERA